MKVYNYTPEDLGFEAFPQGTLRLQGHNIKQVTDPDKADVFVLPPIIRILVPGSGQQPDWNRLPYLEGNEDRHVVYSVADDMYMNTPPTMIAFRCECTQDVLKRNPDTIAWPWPVDDLWAWMSLRDGRFTHDITFHGWVSTGLCAKALDIIERIPYLSHDIRRDKRFWGTRGVFSPEEYVKLRRTFLDSMQASRTSLSVRSIPSGVIRYRFYEAMSMGRFVIHVNDGCVYPFDWAIDYDQVCLRVPEAAVDKIEQHMSAVWALPDQQFIEMGLYAREMWDRYLNSAKWPEIMGEVVKEIEGYL